MRHIPNVLSALRILMVGVFIYFFVQAQYLACLITYITAFLTDLLDGYLARRNNWISPTSAKCSIRLRISSCCSRRSCAF